MAQSYTYSGNIYDAAAAGTTTFALTSTAGNSIGYLQRAHIHVYLSDDDGVTWVEQSRPGSWDFNAEGTSVVLVSGITADQWVKVLRITPLDNRFVDFANGSLLTADQLDVAEDYSRYCDQELADGSASTSGAVTDAPDDGVLYGRQSKTWQPVPDPGVEEAPVDSREYVRVNRSWKEIPEDQTGVPEAPINSRTFARRDASWVEISSTGGIDYKGTRDLTLAAPSAVAGDFYVNTATTGVVDDSWTGIAGRALEGSERVVYNGTIWEMLPMPPAPAGVVEEVVAGNDIVVNSSNPAKPVVSVNPSAVLWSRSSDGYLTPKTSADVLQLEGGPAGIPTMVWGNKSSTGTGGDITYDTNSKLWRFNGLDDEPSGSGDNRVDITTNGEIEANKMTLALSRSSASGSEGSTVLRTTNYSNETFTVSNMGKLFATTYDLESLPKLEDQ